MSRRRSGAVRPDHGPPAAPGVRPTEAASKAAQVRTVLNLLFHDARRLASIDKAKVCLDIFGGTGNVARRWRRLKRASIVIDTAKHPLLDVLDLTVQKTILGWLTSCKVSAVFLAPVCATWSRARRGPDDYSGPPPALRSNRYVLGRPGLRPADQQRIFDGNKMVAFCLKVLRCCAKLSIPCGLENPQNSLMWKHPGLARLLTQRWSETVDLDQCCWGSRRRKPTRLFFVATSATALASLCHRCHPSCGRCSTTGLPHIVLTGFDPVSKRFWTSLAQEYKPSFARAVADVLIQSFDARVMRNLADVFGA